MAILGFSFLVAFPFWEANERLAPHPLIPLKLLKSRTFCGGCCAGFFYFSGLSYNVIQRPTTNIRSVVFYLSIQPYFSSYLLVVHNQSVTAAGHISHTFSFTSTVTGVVVSVVIKYTGRYKYLVLIGSGIYTVGVGLMIRYTTMSSGIGQMVAAQIVMGLGVGMLNVPAQLGVQAAAGPEQVGTATAVFLTAVEMGGATGSAISGAV